MEKRVGRPPGINKNKRFLGCKVTEKEFVELSNILQNSKKKLEITTVDLIKKLFYDLAKKEKIDY